MVPESFIMHDSDGAAERLREIKPLQLKLSVDDFGTDYSSLSYLKRLPLDKLKIDQSFVRDMLQSRDDVAIIRSIIELGGHFGLTVIAEGVQTAEQFDAPREVNCDQARGFHLGRPECTEAFTARLARAAADLAAAPETMSQRRISIGRMPRGRVRGARRARATGWRSCARRCCCGRCAPSLTACTSCARCWTKGARHRTSSGSPTKGWSTRNEC
jgi:hypothetical protein